MGFSLGWQNLEMAVQQNGCHNIFYKNVAYVWNFKVGMQTFSPK